MFPTQKDHDPTSPSEHFVWALRNMPMFAGVGAITNIAILRKWSEHLWDCGFLHRDYLAGLADENGNIHVSQLPRQIKKFQEAFRGPRNSYNNAARWVEANEPDPVPMRIPDIKKLTDQENDAMIQQYRDAGMIPTYRPGPELAQEIS